MNQSPAEVGAMEKYKQAGVVEAARIVERAWQKIVITPLHWFEIAEDFDKVDAAMRAAEILRNAGAYLESQIPEDMLKTLYD